jgi:hypothetical protein
MTTKATSFAHELLRGIAGIAQPGTAKDQEILNFVIGQLEAREREVRRAALEEAAKDCESFAVGATVMAREESGALECARRIRQLGYTRNYTDR